MAPTLTSNSFLLNLTTTPHSNPSFRNTKLTVFAKRSGTGTGPFSPFQLGKPKSNNNANSSSEESPVVDSPNSNPFRFNFGKVPDMKSLIPVVSSPGTGLSFGGSRRKDPGTVYVAGATGQVGVRIAQTLLRQGFSVRAGVADLGAAQELARLAAQYKMISNEEAKRLNAVESAFEDAKSIAKAIGNATKVVVTIGPAENGPTTEVSTSDAIQVIEAAQLAGVSHVAIVYDANSTTNASTYNVLDGISSFFNNLFSRYQPLTLPEFFQKLIETDVNYTFIKTNLAEDFSPESSYNLVVSAEGSTGTNDYKVAKAQIASLVADVFSNTAVAENKVVEVYTDPSAPVRHVDELFSAIPEDGRRAAYAEAIAKAKAEEEARIAAEKAREAAEAAKKLEEEVRKLSEQEALASSLADKAQEKAEAAGSSVETLVDKAKDIGAQFSWEKINSQIATTVKNVTETPKVQIATVRGQAKARSLQPQKTVLKQTMPKPPVSKPKQGTRSKEKEMDSKREVRKVFGGLFQQETIYVDED